MKEEIEKMYVQALIDDLPPNVFADQVLCLFSVMPCDHRYHSKNGRYMLYEDWCEKCGTNCHVV